MLGFARRTSSSPGLYLINMFSLLSCPWSPFSGLLQNLSGLEIPNLYLILKGVGWLLGGLFKASKFHGIILGRFLCIYTGISVFTV
jgi:hypothetical protein